MQESRFSVQGFWCRIRVSGLRVGGLLLIPIKPDIPDKYGLWFTVQVSGVSGFAFRQRTRRVGMI